MEFNYRKFTASSELFQGYSTMIDLNKCDSIHDVVNIFVTRLHSTLVENNFVYLINNFNQSRFHAHGFTFEDIKNSDPDITFYLCDHC